jgi:succinate dehydrogenase / fumarate reductase membrane anchor subunit
MVNHVSSVGRNGVHDFLLIRATAIIMALYTLYLVCFFVFSGTITYELWSQFWASQFTKIFTMLTLSCVLIHGWIGLWQVLTDYVKPVLMRGLLQLLVVTVLSGYFFSGLFVLWGV